MRSAVVKAVGFLLVAGIAAGIYQWRQEPKAAAAAGGPPPGVPVTVAEVTQKTVPLKLNVVGRAEAYSTVTLRSRIDGQILELRYKPGEHVRKGQVMITLDPRILEAQVRQAEANLARDRAQLDKAQSDVERYTELLAKGFVSAAQVEAFRSTQATLAATVKADEASLDLARTQLSYTRIEAPMDGVAGAVLAHPGSMVKANDTSLVVVNQLVPIYVAFAIPESQLREIARVQGGRPFVVEARVPGQSQSLTTGELVFIDNAVDATTGTIQLKGLFKNPDARLTPGQFVEVSMTLRTVDDALLIPSEALQTGPQGTFVYVAKADNTVEVRKLATVALDARTLMVQQGLAAGERVVTDGQLRLTPGARIEVRPARS
jgi:multidrug efflux system membrane fusion protein